MLYLCNCGLSAPGTEVVVHIMVGAVDMSIIGWSQVYSRHNDTMLCHLIMDPVEPLDALGAQHALTLCHMHAVIVVMSVM